MWGLPAGEEKMGTKKKSLQKEPVRSLSCPKIKGERHEESEGEGWTETQVASQRWQLQLGDSKKPRVKQPRWQDGQRELSG